jgi:hypothetical protein
MGHSLKIYIQLVRITKAFDQLIVAKEKYIQSQGGKIKRESTTDHMCYRYIVQNPAVYNNLNESA